MARPESAVGMKWLLGVVVLALLSLTGAWAVSMTEADKDLRAKDAQLEEKIQNVSTADAVKQERLKHIEEKLDEALKKLDELAKK